MNTKIRIWDKAENEWSKPSEYKDFIQWLESGKFPESIVVQNFTGLKDKNGKEIYEGDVIRVKGGVSSTKLKNYITEVEFEFGNFGFMWWLQEGYFSPLQEDFDRPRDIEILGNIFDNPDLLK